MTTERAIFAFGDIIPFSKAGSGRVAQNSEPDALIAHGRHKTFGATTNFCVEKFFDGRLSH